MGEPFAENLRLLCSHYASVAEVCRRIGINRQQFNKYLSGATTPSLHSLRRICDFFGVEEGEIFLPAHEFAELVLVRRDTPSPDSPLAATIDRIAACYPDSQQKLRRYCGYYASYQYTPAYPGLIDKILTVFYQSGDRTYSKSIERLVDRQVPDLGGYVSKYQGLVWHTSDRIHLAEHGSFHEAFIKTVLYPSHRTRLHLLPGLCLSVSGGPGRQAFATRVVYEFLGETADLRSAIAACGLYPEDSDEIDAAIKSRIKNDIAPGESTLCAAEF